MKYLKRFKINESKLPNGLLSLQDIENYFSDFIDDDWEMVESKSYEQPWDKVGKYAKVEGDDIYSVKYSDLPKNDYDYFRRRIHLKLGISHSYKDKNRLLKIISNSYTIFDNSLSHFVTAENIKLISFKHFLEGFLGEEKLKFEFEFLEPLKEEDIDIKKINLT